MEFGVEREKTDLATLNLDNFCREIYDLSDTKIAMLSTAPDDDPSKWFIRK